MTVMTYAPDGSMNVTEGVWYKSIPASSATSGLSGYGAGAQGDWLEGILVIPTTVSPGAVTLFDGTASSVVFAGGTTSTSNLVPFFIPIGARSQNGKWAVTTGASLSVIATGNFT